VTDAVTVAGGIIARVFEAVAQEVAKRF